MRFVCVLMLLVAVCLVGCGPAETTQKVGPPDAQAEIKMALQSVADSGEIDSGLMMVGEQLESLKATDAAKAEELQKDLDELQGLSGDAAKKKAAEMIGKL